MARYANTDPGHYQAVLFDLGNTVIKFDHRISARKIKERYGISELAMYDLFFDSELTRLFEVGKITPMEFYEGVIRLVGVSVSYDEFVTIWTDIFWSDDEVCAIVRELKGKIPLLLISNVNQLHFDFIQRRFDIMKVFDHLILSFQVGSMKPDRRIYEHAAHIGNAEFSRMLYIDDRDDLIKASRAMGIESILFKGARALRKELSLRKLL